MGSTKYHRKKDGVILLVKHNTKTSLTESKEDHVITSNLTSTLIQKKGKCGLQEMKHMVLVLGRLFGFGSQLKKPRARRDEVEERR